MRRERISDETRDGQMFALALLSNPTIVARQLAYRDRIRSNFEAIAEKTKPQLIAALKFSCPAYILESLEKNDLAQLQSRVAYSMESGDRDGKPRQSLGLPPKEKK